jgi:hypothetical protein
MGFLRSIRCLGPMLRTLSAVVRSIKHILVLQYGQRCVYTTKIRGPIGWWRAPRTQVKFADRSRQCHRKQRQVWCVSSAPRTRGTIRLSSQSQKYKRVRLYAMPIVSQFAISSTSASAAKQIAYVRLAKRQAMVAGAVFWVAYHSQKLRELHRKTHSSLKLCTASISYPSRPCRKFQR